MASVLTNHDDETSTPLAPVNPPPAPGRRESPWARPALVALLASTALLSLWGLGASGWANTYYAAAVQAGTKSWKAFVFGSFDASNFITVDKSPAFLWPMELSARVFGLSSWSILVPQALEGVAAVALLYAAVRRWFGAPAGLLAGAVLASTPVAALMFRFNNPDAMLTLLLVGAAYAMVRALEAASTRWLLLVGTLVGFAFLAKMLQAFLVLPGLGLVYLVTAPTPLRRRILQLLAAGAAMLVSAGWWVALVVLTPASARPYVGGSQTNSLWNLLFGYNGFGRLSGNETGSVGGGPQGANGRWGPVGLTRLFNPQFGGQISWLLPAALLFLLGLVIATWRAPRTDRLRSSALLWGGWLLVTGAAISLGQGIIHPYYTVALAPAIGALVAIGATALWRRRDREVGRYALAAVIVVTAWWSAQLLARTPTWNPALRTVVLAGGVAIAATCVGLTHVRGKVGAVLGAAALSIALAGPAAYTLSTVATAHTGAIPSAGPSGAGGFGPGGAQGRRGFGGPGGGPGFGGPGGAPPPFNGGGGRAGGLLSGSTPTAELTAALDANASAYTWVAAAIGANEASGYQLATGDPVMAIGGFNGSDPTPTLAQFQQYVQDGRVHYFIAGGRGGFGGGPGGGNSAISAWVSSTFTARTIGGTTLYDLSSPISS
jgi:4-amino-4-deoxy-L-arabinose transferase-like glycosyltransferase